MAQSLRALTVPLESASLIPITHMVAQNNVTPGALTPFSGLQRDQPSTHDKQTYMEPKYQYI